MASAVKQFDIYAVPRAGKPRKGDSVYLVAVERGPFDPCVSPSERAVKIGTTIAPDKRGALESFREERRNAGRGAKRRAPTRLARALDAMRPLGDDECQIIHLGPDGTFMEVSPEQAAELMTRHLTDDDDEGDDQC